jgi:hypothetical protein
LVVEHSTLADLLGRLHREHHDLLDGGDDAHEQERLGHQLALAQCGPDSEEQLDDDEDQQQQVEHLDGHVLHVGPADAQQLPGGAHEQHDRRDDQQDRDAAVDDVLSEGEHLVDDAFVHRCVVVDVPALGHARHHSMIVKRIVLPATTILERSWSPAG